MKKLRLFILAIISLAGLTLGPTLSLAQDAPAAEKTEAVEKKTEVLQKETTESTQKSLELQKKTEDLQKNIDEQKKAVDKAASMKDQLETLQKQLNDQQSLIDDQRQQMRSMQADIDKLNQQDPSELSADQVKLRTRMETLEESITASKKASTGDIDKNFPGSIPIPGGNAAIKIGGFVKASMILGFDPIGSDDRFIVGSIPVPSPPDSDSEFNLTVSQSRLNFDLRDRSTGGILRAFIEGDFAEDNDTFRLRHAFGQYQKVLIGKTDSAFSDVSANPEEIDFEGLNGMINVRQTQVRISPEIGKDLNLVVSLEDPQPDIENGDGVSQVPDLIVSIDRTWFKRWHVKSSLLLRSIRGRFSPDPGTIPSIKDDAFGYALSFSGKRSVPYWHPSDNLIYQFSIGKGYGRYVNDLASIGGGDAVFDNNGNLKARKLFATYLGFQHWWGDAWRSTFLASIVDIDNEDFEPDSAYSKTGRLSGNVIYSPHPRIDVGSELIWGKRTNKNGDNEDAEQIQVSAKYRF